VFDDKLTRSYRGAVLSQLPSELTATIISTVAVRHYGVEALSAYNEIEDAGQPKIWSKYHGQNRCMRMTWYIQMVLTFHFCVSVSFHSSELAHSLFLLRDRDCFKKMTNLTLIL
jgi:hypothetical protein